MVRDIRMRADPQRPLNDRQTIRNTAQEQEFLRVI